MTYGVRLSRRKKFVSGSDFARYRVWRNEHPNFITPDEVASKQINHDTFVELSEGTDFEHKPFFGVSIIKKKGNSFTTLHEDNRSKSFSSKEEAVKYYNSIK